MDNTHHQMSFDTTYRIMRVNRKTGLETDMVRTVLTGGSITRNQDTAITEQATLDIEAPPCSAATFYASGPTSTTPTAPPKASHWAPSSPTGPNGKSPAGKPPVHHSTSTGAYANSTTTNSPNRSRSPPAPTP